MSTRAQTPVNSKAPIACAPSSQPPHSIFRNKNSRWHGMTTITKCHWREKYSSAAEALPRIWLLMKLICTQRRNGNENILKTRIGDETPHCEVRRSAWSHSWYSCNLGLSARDSCRCWKDCLREFPPVGVRNRSKVTSALLDVEECIF